MFSILMFVTSVVLLWLGCCVERLLTNSFIEPKVVLA